LTPSFALNASAWQNANVSGGQPEKKKRRKQRNEVPGRLTREAKPMHLALAEARGTMGKSQKSPLQM